MLLTCHLSVHLLFVLSVCVYHLFDIVFRIVIVELTAGGSSNCDGLEDGENIVIEIRPNEATSWEVQ